MIKNVIFDLGNAIIRWDPDAIVRKFAKSERDIQISENEVFYVSEWKVLQYRCS